MPVSQVLPCGRPLSTSLEVLELCFKVRVIREPLWKSLETVGSVIKWVLLWVFVRGQCLGNSSLILCFNGLSFNR